MTNRRLMKKVAGMSYVSPAWLAVATAAFVAGCGGGEGGNPQTPNEARLQEVTRSPLRPNLLVTEFDPEWLRGYMHGPHIGG